MKLRIDRPRLARRRLPGILVLGLLAAALPGFGAAAGAFEIATPSDSRLTERRSARRQAMREAVADARKSERPAAFGLLVIPVDFADARLPRRWDPSARLGPRLFPLHGETLVNYYRIASRGRLDLRILLAPLVRLPEERLAYSDIGYATFERSRRLATEALEAALLAGVDFRLLDMDGPDGVPGSADDDGEVDGVLVLHAGIGQENDLEDGLIQALQFYLDEPVTDRGVAASTYAVASLRSGLGIWAHETGHLLGMEDRYDVFFSVHGDGARSRGGLGNFSLMAAGAWGVGGGKLPSLPDAYTAAQLGWVDVRDHPGDGRADTLGNWLAGGEVWRVWTRGWHGPEYFLLETRGGLPAAPFDALVDPGQLMVLHVDEEVPERSQSSSDPLTRHLRVALVEADGEPGLTRAEPEDYGGVADLFPGSLGIDALTPASIPSSAGYDGPSEVALTEITSRPAGVALRVSHAATRAFEVSLGFRPDPFDPEGRRHLLKLRVEDRGVPVDTLTARVRVTSNPAYGAFRPGDYVVNIPMKTGGDGIWLPVTPPVWMLDASLPQGARTVFEIEIAGDGWTEPAVTREWVWLTITTVLDFAELWPGQWRISGGGDPAGTTWYRWAVPPFLTDDGSPVLICTGDAYATPAFWPDVQYGNGADVILTSGDLPPGLDAVRIIHALDTESLRPGTGLDGAVVEFTRPEGGWEPAAPLDGYDGAIESSVDCALHGRAAFFGEDDLVDGRPATWRIDVFPVPDHGGPVRMRLRLASDPAFRGRGWVVARIDPVSPPPRASAFPVAIHRSEDDGELMISWDWYGPLATGFVVELSRDQGVSWLQAWQGVRPLGEDGYQYGVPYASLDTGGDPGADHRTLVRVVATTGLGRIGSAPRVLYRDGGAPTGIRLAAPYPNPARGEVHLFCDVPRGQSAELAVFDIRGRRLRTWHALAGRQLLVWDGRDGHGRRLPSGTYLFRLEYPGRTHTRKALLRW